VVINYSSNVTAPTPASRTHGGPYSYTITRDPLYRVTSVYGVSSCFFFTFLCQNLLFDMNEDISHIVFGLAGFLSELHPQSYQCHLKQAANREYSNYPFSFSYLSYLAFLFLTSLLFLIFSLLSGSFSNLSLFYRELLCHRPYILFLRTIRHTLTTLGYRTSHQKLCRSTLVPARSIFYIGDKREIYIFI